MNCNWCVNIPVANTATADFTYQQGRDGLSHYCVNTGCFGRGIEFLERRETCMILEKNIVFIIGLVVFVASVPDVINVALW